MKTSDTNEGNGATIEPGAKWRAKWAVISMCALECVEWILEPIKHQIECPPVMYWSIVSSSLNIWCCLVRWERISRPCKIQAVTMFRQQTKVLQHFLNLVRFSEMVDLTLQSKWNAAKMKWLLKTEVSDETSFWTQWKCLVHREHGQVQWTCWKTLMRMES